MTRKKTIEKNEQVGLRLSLAERKLILEEPIHIHDKLAEPIRSTPTNAPVMLTLDDLDDLAGYIAAEANHTTDKTLRKKLDAIFSKIQDLLETHTDEEPPRSVEDRGCSAGEATDRASVATRRMGGEDADRCRAARDQVQAGRTVPSAGGGAGGADDDPHHRREDPEEAHCEEPETHGRRGRGAPDGGFRGDARRPSLAGFRPDHDRQEPDELPGVRGDRGVEARRIERDIQHDLPTQDHPGGHRASDLASGRGARLLAGRTARRDPGRHGLAEQPHAPVHREREVLRASHDRRPRPGGRGSRTASASARSSRAGRSLGSSTSTTSATPGSTRSVWRRRWSQSPRSSIPGASKEPGLARPRTAAVPGAMPISWKRWRTRSTRATGT